MNSINQCLRVFIMARFKQVMFQTLIPFRKAYIVCDSQLLALLNFDVKPFVLQVPSVDLLSPVQDSLCSMMEIGIRLGAAIQRGLRRSGRIFLEDSTGCIYLINVSGGAL